MTNAKINTAKTFGAIAFANGLPCVPSLCSDLLAAIKGRAVGDKRTTQEMKEWIAGWTQANLAKA